MFTTVRIISLIVFFKFKSCITYIKLVEALDFFIYIGETGINGGVNDLLGTTIKSVCSFANDSKFVSSQWKQGFTS